MIKTPSIDLFTLVKSKRASSHPTGAAQSSVSKFDAGNAIDDFHAGLLLYTCAVTNDIIGRFLASWQHSARAGDKINSKWLMWTLSLVSH
ncbi:MAG: hypothetical protein ACR5LF_13805 [Symbiopectobacterium sp.]